MASLWFVVPAHGRLSLSRVCLRQLARTCQSLRENGLEASAVVVACDANLDTARALGFGTVQRSNHFLSSRYNDGIQLACDPKFNPRPVDYVVPCGSDDWVDWKIFLELPEPDAIRAFQHISFVREDGRELTSRFLDYRGGAGIRIYPRQVVERLGYRPADEDRRRGCDTSILLNAQGAFPKVKIEYGDVDPRSIVDWKSPREQLNTYDEISRRYRVQALGDPFVELEGIFPDVALEEMAVHYSRSLAVA